MKYLCHMKSFHFDKFEIYTRIIWAIIGIGIWIQFSSYEMSLFESGLFAFSFILMLYPLSTYLSKPLLKKAIQREKAIPFVMQAIIISVLSAALVTSLLFIFVYFESIGWFHRSMLYQGESDSVLHDFVGAIISVLFINFGLCGLRFFEENLKLQKTLIDSQLQILQAQINPHFMFNVLNHVNVLIKKEPDLASQLLVQYTSILRYQLYNGNEEVVNIMQEISFLKNFIEIEKVRWKNNLEVTCSWSIVQKDIMIPPLLFITFVENAFKHVSRSKREKGFVNIELRQEKEKIVLQVVNSKFSDVVYEKKGASGIGLENITKRLNILFHDKYSLIINETATVYSTILTLNIQ